jgi:hypothetical protein
VRRTDADPAGAVDIHQPGDAQHGIGTEAQRIEEGIVDAAVDHVHPLRAFGGAHPDIFAIDEQILPLDQFHPHQVGQQRVFVIGRVEMARRQDHHHGSPLHFAGATLASVRRSFSE